MTTSVPVNEQELMSGNKIRMLNDMFARRRFFICIQ